MHLDSADSVTFDMRGFLRSVQDERTLCAGTIPAHRKLLVPCCWDPEGLRGPPIAAAYLDGTLLQHNSVAAKLDNYSQISRASMKCGSPKLVRS